MGILPQALIQTEADRRPPVFERPSGRIGILGQNEHSAPHCGVTSFGPSNFDSLLDSACLRDIFRNCLKNSSSNLRSFSSYAARA